MRMLLLVSERFENINFSDADAATEIQLLQGSEFFERIDIGESRAAGEAEALQRP